MGTRTCSVAGCQRTVHARGMCGPHYSKAWSSGKFQAFPDTDTSNWTTEMVAWVAGVIEGEGCFECRVGKRKKNGKMYLYNRITVGMTDEDVVRRLQSVTGVGTVVGPYWRNKSTKPVWLWKVSRTKDVVSLTNYILPWLGKRRRETAEKMLDAIKIKKSLPTLLVSEQSQHEAA